MEQRHTAILLIDCPDRKGLVAAIADFLYTHGANILHADQHQDNELGLFFMRVEWSLQDFDLTRELFRERFEPIAARFQMNWRVEYSDRYHPPLLGPDEALKCQTAHRLSLMKQ